MDAYFDPPEYKDGKLEKVTYQKGELVDEQNVTFGGKETVFIPEIDGVGVYVVEAVSGLNAPRDASSEDFVSFFLINTKQNVSTERLGHDVVSWVVDQKTASGVQAARVVAYDSKRNVVLQESSGEQGEVRIKVDQKDEKKPQLLKTQIGDDVTFTVLLDGWWGGFYGYDYRNRIDEHKGYAFTDRPLYTPGDTVEFKALVRAYEDGVYQTVPAEVEVEVSEITYGRTPNVIYGKKLKTNGEGSVSDSISLSEELKTGKYSITVKDGDVHIASAVFNVEYYQKPDVDITIGTDKDVLIQGQDTEISVNAKYFFGEPLANQDIEIEAYTYYSDAVGTGKKIVTLDGQGNGKTSVNLSGAHRSSNSWWRQSGMPVTLEAVITDPSDRETRKQKVVEVHPGQFRIELKEGQRLWSLDPNQQHRAIFRVVDNLTGEALANKKLSVRLEKNRYSGPIREPLLQREMTSDVLGDIEVDFTLSSGGSHRMYVEGEDDLGNTVKRTFYLYARGSSTDTVGDGETVYTPEIIVAADKETYRDGDTAVLTLDLPRTQGQLMWSVNTKVYRNHGIEEVAGAQHTIEIPISGDLAPGFYVSLVMHHDDGFVDKREFIEVEGKKVTVEVSPKKEVAGPAEKFSIDIKTLDVEGNPIATESAISVVDKALLALKSDQAVDIFDAFYPKPDDWLIRRSSQDPVMTSGAEGGGCFLPGTKILMADGSEKNIEDVIVGDMILTREGPFKNRLIADRVVNTMRHDVKEYMIINGTLRVTPVHRILVNGQWTEIGQVKIGDWLIDVNGQKVIVETIEHVRKPVTVYNFETQDSHTYLADYIYVHNDKGGGGTVRSNFVDTAYWNAHVKTGGDGKASVSFDLPDNLTTWVAMVRSASKETDVGQNTGEFKTHKDFLIRPSVPQFVRANDKITLTAVVHNNGNEDARNVENLLVVKGGTVLSESVQRAFVSARDVKKLSWTVGVNEVDELDLTFETKGKKPVVHDVVKLKIPVYSDLSLDRQVHARTGDTALSFNIPSGASQQYSNAKVTLTPSVAASLPNVIEKLTGYPYGCVEQTMSKQLPNILTYKEKGLIPVDNVGNLEEQLAEGFDRLVKMQHDDGGFGWWEHDESDFMMSGYVLEGLHYAEQAGLLKGKEGMKTELVKFLKGRIENLPAREKAYIVYVLSQAEPGSVETHIKGFSPDFGERYTELTPQDLAYIALAFHNEGKTGEALTLLAELKESYKDGHWEMPKSDLGHGTMQDKYSATGVGLLALLQIEGESQMTQEITQWLMLNRNGYMGLWGSTRQSTQILLGLVEYLKNTNELSPNYAYNVDVNGSSLAAGKVTNAFDEVSVNIPMKMLHNVNTLDVRHDGAGNMYTSLVVQSFVPGSSIVTPSSSLSISRSYTDMSGNTVTNFTPGQIVKVRLRVGVNGKVKYLMVEDYLPAGFEPLNQRLDSTSKKGQKYGYGGGWYNSIDMRDQRVSIFRSYVWGQTQDFEYLARVSHPGTFSAPAPRAELMYSPDQYAVGRESIVTVK